MFLLLINTIQAYLWRRLTFKLIYFIQQESLKVSETSDYHSRDDLTFRRRAAALQLTPLAFDL